MNANLIITIVIVLAAIYAGTKYMALAPVEVPPHPETATSGGPAIGGAFTLVDQSGAPYTEKNLRGHYSLVFFGFSHCPDMCPTALANITAALDSMLPKAAEKITPVLITVDPERDTPEVLKAYAANFHPRLVALTGTEEQTEQAASAFKVYHQVSDPSVDDYMVNHSGFIYVMGPDGEYIKHFTHTTAPESMAIELEQIVR